MAKKFVFLFEEGNKNKKNLLGGKGANIAEMTRRGLPVPPGFTLTTELCNYFLSHGRKLPKDAYVQVRKAVRALEKKTGRKFGSKTRPLLVSVRSGAPVSMPGMMDTILNLGLNDVTLNALARETKDRRFALDSYRRFIQMFASVVMEVPHDVFEKVLEKQRNAAKVKSDSELKEKHLEKVVAEYKRIYKTRTKSAFPSSPSKQLDLAIKAVFNSWNIKRARTYRRLNGISDDLGTGVNVQAMVFGNTGFNSGTGVVFTRNPANGKKELYGEYLINAQGEEVVAGIRTPKPIVKLKKEFPAVYARLLKIAKRLERFYREVQDIEFTFDNGKLFILQTRDGKRTANAAVKIAVDLCVEGVISRKDAILRVSPEQISMLLHRQIDPDAKVRVVATGLAASPGAACGTVVFDADEAEKRGEKGDSVLLVRPETAPDDIHGMVAAQGILTSRGGLTSHAAVVARGMGKPCVAGCGDVKISPRRKQFTVNGITVKRGDVITIDGTAGRVMLGEVKTIEPKITNEVKTLLKWADAVRKLGVRANADTPKDAKRAREFGAEGIGLCRTEHMFMEKSRLPIVKKMIIAKKYGARRRELEKLRPMQLHDFFGIFKAMDGLPVIIRLLDPPLHEFLPNRRAIAREISKLEMQNKPKELEKKKALYRVVSDLSESNPMLGHRGCRLGISHPEIYEMQVHAIFEAAVKAKRTGIKVKPYVMIPLVGVAEELRVLREMAEKVAKEVMRKTGVKFSYKIGTMIELPRGCTNAGEIAKYADFFSFGTNDLTQTVFGYSRDDVEAKFIGVYMDRQIIRENPFETLDQSGVGELIKIAVKRGRGTKKDLDIGICGEHGGDAKSIGFFHKIGLKYVSCSPFRVPVARLAAAHAALGAIK